MIYVKMHGRLGNQFFQYAFARTLAEERQDKIFLDFTNIEEERELDPKGGWENSLQYFQIRPDTVTGKIPLSLKQWGLEKLYKHLFRTYRQFDKTPQNRQNFELKARDRFAQTGFLIATGYYPYGKLPQGDLYLDGYFESPKYFEPIKDLIQQEFVPKEPVRAQNKELYTKILNTEAICVTIRRGDFVYKEGVARAANICTQDYFYQGVDYILKRSPQAKVFVFSDDIPWAKANLRFPVETAFESGTDPVWEKMRLMSACKHFVISNSTFSWWAQHLGSNSQKIVVAPDKWRREGYDDVALYEPNWVLLKI